MDDQEFWDRVFLALISGPQIPVNAAARMADAALALRNANKVTPDGREPVSPPEPTDTTSASTPRPEAPCK